MTRARDLALFMVKTLIGFRLLTTLTFAAALLAQA
jgi:hypothetical protein